MNIFIIYFPQAHRHHQFLLLLFIAPGDVAAAATAENMRMHASSGEDVKIDCQIGRFR